MSTDTLIGRSLLGLAALLLATELVGWLLAGWRQPRVLGGLLAAIALGPTLLGRLPGDPTSFLFPAEGRPAITVIGKLGLVLFAFAIGLELETARIRRQSRAALSIATGALALPLLTGSALAVALYHEHAGDYVSLSTFVLFVATATAITAFPVLVAILVERGVQKTDIGELAIGSAAVQDVVGWVLLATALATLSTGNFADVARLVIVIGGLVAGLFALQPLARRFAPTLGGESRQLALAAGFACLCAAITELVGLEAVAGAFAAGLAFPRADDDRRATIAGSLMPVTVSILLPIYFLGAGLQLDLSVSGPGWLLEAGLITAVTGASKLVGGAVPARALGLPRRQAAAIGILVNTRGLMELIVLTLGYSDGVIDSRLYGEMVVMALACTLMTGPALDRLCRRDAPTLAQGSGQDRLWGREAPAG